MTHKSDDFLGRPNSHSNRAAFPENLDSLSAVELADQLEQFLNTMTEYTYDEAVVDAYLEALNHKVPMPKIKSTNEAYAEFLEYLRDRQAKPLQAGGNAFNNNEPDV